MTYDCPTTTTPKPTEDQVCTYVPLTNTAPANTNTATGGNTNTAPAGCTTDTWSCGDWSVACNTQGEETRTCTLTSDCASVSTPPPASVQACSHLQCGNKPELRERILCRLNLSAAGVARELAIQFLPEECRVMTDAEQKKECISYYKSYQPCWSLPAGVGRFDCARGVLKLGPIISQEVKTCQGKTGNDQVQCKADVREKVFDFVKFRLYDLEQRAEELGDRGVSLNTIADLETVIEQQKQAFGTATNKAQRRQAVLNVRLAWNAFVAEASQQIRP